MSLLTTRKRGKQHKYTMTGNIGCVLKVPITPSECLKAALANKDCPVNSFYRKIRERNNIGRKLCSGTGVSPDLFIHALGTSWFVYFVIGKYLSV